MASIEKGVVTRTTKNRLEELEAEEDKLLTTLQLEQAKAPKITKGMILFLLDKFRKMDMHVMKNREKLIDSLVKAIILYDDRILIYLTYTDETVTIPTSEEVSDVENSLDVASSGVPTRKGRLRPLFFCWYTGRDSKDFNRNMPVAYCCHQFKNWGATRPPPGAG